MYGLNDLTIEELEAELAEMGISGFRCRQVCEWVFRGVASFDEMTNVSKEVRAKLSEKYEIKAAHVIDKFESKLDDTKKYLLELNDGNIVEAVRMKYHHGNTICLSSQVGCKMGCKFCASTIGGHLRNLTAGEMLMQIHEVQRDIGERISNIVLMGIGEPLDNYDNVVRFLKNVNNPLGLNIGYRHISLSTCGLVDKIRRLAEEDMPITLSVSLHAPDNETRDKIMPVNKRFSVEELIDECKSYIEKTNRRISFEYILIDGVNDTQAHAEKLAKLLTGMLCHVNLIPANEVKETGMKKTPAGRVKMFQDTLTARGINATVRRELGKDINASCGQLRKGHTENRGD